MAPVPKSFVRYRGERRKIDLLFSAKKDEMNVKFCIKITAFISAFIFVNAFPYFVRAD